MGMYLELYTSSDANLDILRQYPRYIHHLTNPDIADSMERQGVDVAQGFWSIVFGRTAASRPKVAPPVFTPPQGAHMDIDKAWHGLHYLLTGKEQQGEKPLDFLLFGGAEVGQDPSLVLIDSAETKAIAEALKPISKEFLQARFKPTAMRNLDIYPASIWRDDDDMTAEDSEFFWLFDYFEQMRDFIVDAANSGLGLIKLVG